MSNFTINTIDLPVLILPKLKHYNSFNKIQYTSDCLVCASFFYMNTHM